jgi:hypothetical protein
MATTRKKTATVCEKNQTPPFAAVNQNTVPKRNSIVSEIWLLSRRVRLPTSVETEDAVIEPITTETSV